MKKSFALFLLFVFTGSPFSFAQKASKTIQIDGKSQHYQLDGIKNRKLGQPLIILEGDLGAYLENWNRVILEIEENIPVLAYDRAGLGNSEAIEELPTPANRTKQLKRLLDELELAPPYILVSDGWGAILMNHFAQTYPEDIDGMIYIDPMDKTLSKESMISIVDREGMDGEKIATDYFNMRREVFKNAPAEVKGEGEAMLDFFEGKTQDLKLYDFPEIPSVILVGGKHMGYMENPLNPSLGLNYQELLNMLQLNRIADFTKWVLNSKDSELVVISNYMHYLHLQEPEKVASAILSKYYGKPSDRIISASEKYTAEEFGEFLEGLLAYFPENKIPESLINGLGYDQLRRDQPEHAIALFQYNLDRFPDSANVYDSMGDGLVALGKAKEAVPYFEKAVEMGEVSKHSDLELFKKNLASAKEEK